MCEDGCVIVQRYLKSKRYIGRIRELKCYQEIINENYGHLNYAVMSYAASKGHIECIKQLHEKQLRENDAALWHSDLAIVAAENDQLECLKYIIQQMGKVNCDPNNYKDIPNRCKTYMDEYFESMPE